MCVEYMRDENPYIHGVVPIDYSGTPGTTAPSEYLHLDRKSWAAVIVAPADIDRIGAALKMFAAGIKSDYGAEELHFTDIYNGRREFKGAPTDRRFEIFDLMAHIFESFHLSILFQTSSPQFLAEVTAHLPRPLPAVDWFDLSKHEHFSLLYIIHLVRAFIKSDR